MFPRLIPNETIDYYTKEMTYKEISDIYILQQKFGINAEK